MARQPIPWFPLVIVLVLMYAFFTPFTNIVDNIFGISPAPEPAPTDDVDVDFCADPSVTMTIGPMIKMYAPGTSVTGEFARVFVDDVDQGLKGDGTTLGVTWKDKVVMYYAENSSTYYAAKSAFTVPCRSTIDTAKYDSNAHKLYQLDGSTNLNFKYFCEDDGLLNAAATTESIVAGDVLTISGSIQGQYQDAYSPYGGAYITIKYNSSCYDELVFTPTTAGFSVSDAPTPTVRSNAAAAAQFALKTVKLNKGLISNEKMEFTLMIDAHDSNDPTVYDGNITIYYDDEDWFRNTDTGVMEFGPEDNDDAIVGDAVYTALFYVG